MSSKVPKSELKYWIGFNQLPIIGPVRLQKLLNYFGDLKAAWHAGQKGLLAAGIEEKISSQIINLKSTINPEAEADKVEKANVKTVTIKDDTYPHLLKEIYAPPPLLYYLGELNNLRPKNLAVVGSRKISEYGRLVTAKMVSDLVRQGFVITSGLAFGIDACAHTTTLENHGTTVAVLGCGLQQIYPASHRNLAKKITLEGGLIFSEFPITMPPLKHNFPIRNRLISGLSLGTLVIEAHEKSGALITAAYALEQGREVFAVPGNIFHIGSAGPHRLITSGARLVNSITDIIETLNVETLKEKQTAAPTPSVTPTEKKIIEILLDGPLHVDKIVQYVRLDISVVNANLSVMEIKGLIKHIGSNVYSTTAQLS
ncbi:MAG: DNA-protecting protein DprA [Candidatus Buchananbacteria bacterium]|nr:DNA-protecting protein DprA [Candidatus Buchananbacteria bacterium]